jgi:kumamolisin
MDSANTPNGFRQLAGSHRDPLKGAAIVKAADPSEKITISIHLRRGKQFDAKTFPNIKHWAQHSPLKQKALSHEELAGQVSASPEDIKQVTDFLKGNGLTIIESDPIKRSIRAEGTTAQIEHAFSIKINYYKAGSQTYRGREGYLFLPEGVSDIIKGVFGIDNRQVAHRNATSSAPPAGTQVLTPPSVADLYEFPQNIDASSQTVGIIEFGGGYSEDDVISYCEGLGIKNPVLKSVGIPPASNSPAGSASNVTYNDPDFEVLLDIEVIATVAPGVNIVVYFAPNTDDGWINAFKTAVYDTTNNPSVFSISWGGTETGWAQQSINALSEIFQEAASMKKTIFISSGDNGTDDGQGDGQAHVEYPASDPYVTACGGTVISNVAGNTFNEQVWNDVGASGGGISTVFNQVPEWQQGANIPVSVNPGGGTGRGVPDIAGNASPYSGYFLTIYGKSTSVLQITSGDGAGSTYGSEGGTSAVAPLFAGLTALLNSGLGQPVGYLNPTLYSLINTNAFNQITVGNNAFAGAPGYQAGPGWNACTGLGSVNGTNLLNAIKAIINQQ